MGKLEQEVQEILAEDSKLVCLEVYNGSKWK